MNDIFFLLWSYCRFSSSFKVEEDPHTKKLRIVLAERTSVLDKAELARTLRTLPENSRLEIDGTGSRSIDHNTLVVIHNFKATAKRKNIRLELTAIP